MRAIRFLGAMAASLVGASFPALASMGAGVDRFVERSPRDPSEPRALKVREARRAGKRTDPFFGIASKGRRGARQRAAEMAHAFTKTNVGKRNARGRALSR